MNTLPIPSVEAQNHSQQLILLIENTIKDSGGWIDFAQFMYLTLYAHGLGYYSAGSQKFGSGGDFVTAPEMSPLFGQVISNQIAQILCDGSNHILELGAGTGKLATDILLTLEKLNILPNRYFILEVSDHLHQVQYEYLNYKLPQKIMERVEWLSELPTEFEGVIIGNEVLDAIPVNIIHSTSEGIFERGVACNGQFIWQDKPLDSEILLDAVNKLQLPEGYVTEFCSAANGLIASLAKILKKGMILMIDYGFSAKEYYHPQRNQGTLMCHYQHYSHTDPFINIGLQDITAHVDFTSIARTAINNGMELSGFCSQAQFLINCGILDILSEVSPSDFSSYASLASAAQKFLSPAEMGDLFKVLALTKNVETALLGFTSGDKSYML